MEQTVLKKRGRGVRVKRDPLERFAQHVCLTRTCWIWEGARFYNGYGVFDHQLAHRFAYEIFIGRIPEGKEINHTCFTRACVNPHHLEIVTRRENVIKSRPCVHGKPRIECSSCQEAHRKKMNERRRLSSRGYAGYAVKNLGRGSQQDKHNLRFLVLVPIDLGTVLLEDAERRTDKSVSAMLREIIAKHYHYTGPLTRRDQNWPVFKNIRPIRTGKSPLEAP